MNKDLKFQNNVNESSKISSYAELWKGLGIIVDIWIVIYFIIMLVLVKVNIKKK